MTVYYKAVRPNGRDFHSDSVQWAPEKVKARKGRIVKHPSAYFVGDEADEYLSVSTVPTDCTGMDWPCRLLVVEPVGEVTTPHPHPLPNKRAAVAFRVVAEVDPLLALGPQGEHVAALIERIGRLTTDEAHALSAALDVRYAAWDVRYAAWDAARAAAREAARVVTRACAAGALVVRDLISTEHYDTLTMPLRRAGITIHPDDPSGVQS